MPPINIGGTTFHSKRHAMQHVQDLFLHIGETSDLTGSPHAPFVMALLQRHPKADAKLAGLHHVELRRNGMGVGILLHYHDRDIDDISWRSCISGKPRSDKDRLHDALREAVQTQIDVFRSAHAGDTMCANCKSPLQWNVPGMVHVDHDTPTFVQLAQSFCAQARPDMAVVSHPHGLYRHRLTDDVVRHQWQAFHQQHARLQIVCCHCNLGSLPRQRRSAHGALAGPITPHHACGDSPRF